MLSLAINFFLSCLEEKMITKRPQISYIAEAAHKSEQLFLFTVVTSFSRSRHYESFITCRPGKVNSYQQKTGQGDYSSTVWGKVEKPN